MKFTTSLIRFEINNLKRVVIKTITHTKPVKDKRGKVVLKSMEKLAAPTQFWTFDKERSRWFMRITDPDDLNNCTIRSGMNHDDMRQYIHLAMGHYPQKKVWFSGDTCNITIDHDLMKKYLREQKKKQGRHFLPPHPNCGCSLIGGNLIIKKRFEKPLAIGAGDDLTLTIEFEDK
jgi:hypothetical protein